MTRTTYFVSEYYYSRTKKYLGFHRSLRELGLGKSLWRGAKGAEQNIEKLLFQCITIVVIELYDKSNYSSHINYALRHELQ